MLHERQIPDTKLNDNEETPQSNVETHCNAMKEIQSSYFCVIPVIIRSVGSEARVYDFLDQGSDTTFCDESLITELSMVGTPRRITVNTVGRRPIRRDCVSVKFTVLSLDGEEELL